MSIRLSIRAGAIAGAISIAWGLAIAHAQDARTEQRTISIRGTERSYLVHVPPNAGRGAPVVFVFHGGGGRPESIENVTGMDALADQNGFVAVYPAGEPAPSGRGGTWNVGGFAGGSADDVGFVRAILRDLGRSVAIDPSRVYAAGHSMGGVFAYRLACEMSGTFAAIAAVSATMVEGGCHPHSPVAVLHIHGSDDDRIPLDGGHGAMTAVPGRSWPAPKKGVSAWARFDGCTGQPSESAGSGTCTTYGQCRAPVDFCVIQGGGHPWPAGAADRIWAFFAANPKR